MKNIADKLFWVVLILLGLYMLYNKGIILANFESVNSKVAYEMIEQNDGNLTVLDVRTVDEFKKDGHLVDAKLIPLQLLGKNLNMLDKSKKILVYCRSGSRSVSASRILSDAGFTVVNMSGGIIDWKAEKLPIK
nr:MAG: rhodanese-like domain-containing protein [Sulfurovum sp.]